MDPYLSNDKREPVPLSKKHSSTRQKVNQALWKHTEKLPSFRLTPEKPLSLHQIDLFDKDEISRIDPAKNLSKYQKSDEFRPDQLDKHPSGHLTQNLIIESDQVHLNEIKCMKQALLEVQKRGPLPSWACQSIKTWFGVHYEWVEARYYLTRDSFIPRLEARFHFPEEVKQAGKLCFETLQCIASMVNKIKENDSLDDLQKIWSSYEKSVSLLNTLQQTMTIVLYHAFFSPTDVYNLHVRYQSKNVSARFGSFIHYMGVEKIRSEIMPREGYPPMSWSLHFKKHYDTYVKNSVANLNVLLSEKIMEPSLVPRPLKRRRGIGNDSRVQFDPFDPIYQVSKDFPPNKLEEWEDDFEDHLKGSPRHIANCAHLAEAADMKKVLIDIHRRGSLKDWERLSIQKWFRSHKKWVVDYHNHFNTSCIQWCSTRFHYPSVLSEGSIEYIQTLDNISNLIESLKPGDEVHTLMTKWSEYDRKIRCFFEHFNKMHFTLVHTYFSKKDLSDYHINVAEKGTLDVGPVIYHFGEDKFRNMLMKREKIEDVHWHLVFGIQYISYCEKVAIHMKALKSGVAPKSDNYKSSNLLSALDDLWDVPSELHALFDD
mmetsp:Transcript_1322/g.2090  ORF Transcript_1322/g.2090 Transcript_1322/m.2090 type:complete len:598 (-) Transcript_1322:398-2191(-)